MAGVLNAFANKPHRATLLALAFWGNTTWVPTRCSWVVFPGFSQHGLCPWSILQVTWRIPRWKESSDGLRCVKGISAYPVCQVHGEKLWDEGRMADGPWIHGKVVGESGQKRNSGQNAPPSLFIHRPQLQWGTWGLQRGRIKNQTWFCDSAGTRRENVHWSQPGWSTWSQVSYVWCLAVSLPYLVRG